MAQLLSLCLVRHLYGRYNVPRLKRLFSLYVQLELEIKSLTLILEKVEVTFFIWFFVANRELLCLLSETSQCWLVWQADRTESLLHIKISSSQRERSATFPWQRQLLMLGEGDVRFMTLYFISSQFYSDSMNIKCNKNVIYSRREFCIGVQEKRIYLQNCWVK